MGLIQFCLASLRHKEIRGIINGGMQAGFWLGKVRHQTFTWTYVDRYLWRIGER